MGMKKFYGSEDNETLLKAYFFIFNLITLFWAYKSIARSL